MTDTIALPRDNSIHRQFSINKPLFVSPGPAGRKITAGFSYLQRIGKSANIDVWFPDAFRRELDALMEKGARLGPEHFPAEWAAVRQFELLQEAGNYKIYDMDASYLTRTMLDLSKSMRAGGYRVTVATIGSYTGPESSDDLAILDRRLQERISRLTHMMYLEEESEKTNAALDKVLAAGLWDYQTALPHVGLTLGARDLFQPFGGAAKRHEGTFVIPGFPHEITVAEWLDDLGVADDYGQKFIRVATRPQAGEYMVLNGVYRFASADAGREVVIAYLRNTASQKPGKSERRHRLAQQFFDILSLLPQKHVVHDMAVGLQLPESIAENEWIYLADSDMKLGVFNSLLNDLFEPFGKSSAQHMRGYGDHMNAGKAGFYRDAAASLYAARPI